MSESQMASVSSIPQSIASVNSVNSVDQQERVYPSDLNATVPPIRYDSGPCAVCNCKLQTGSLIVAEIGLLLGLIFLVIGAVVLALKPQIADATLDIYNPSDKPGSASLADALEYSSVIILIRGFYYLLFYSILLIGAKGKNRCICITWIIIHLSLITLTVIGTLLVIVTFGHAYISIPPLVTILPEIYFIWIIFAYSEELKVVGVVGGKPAVLNEDIYDADAFTTGMYGSGGSTTEYRLPPHLANSSTSQIPKNHPPSLLNASAGDVTGNVGGSVTSVKHTYGWKPSTYTA